ncbi:hypothetical protein GCM10009430_17260 [Aquimarina litoralis]|uniref:Uncharacterized protein n=1 Tax=Aquimarina litoralis TaxID=584605 RepID=A0ABN1IPI4_9FLAO
MQKTTTILLLLFITTNTLLSQNLQITRRDFTDPNNYVHSLIELNETNGTILDTYDYTATFSGFNAVESLTYNQVTKEVFGISGDLILKYNLESGTEDSFTLPSLASGDYQDVIIANNRLFVSRRDFTDPNNYIHSLVELNQTDGSVINAYDYTATFPGFNSVESLTYNSETSEIFGISDNLILKYNIETGNQGSFTLPSLTSGDYQDVVIANNRLYVSRRDFTDPNNYIHSLVELNQTDGSVISTYDYTATFPGFDAVESLTYSPETSEIIGFSETLVLKYSIDTGTENSFSMPTLSSGDYGAIVSTADDPLLSVEDIQLPEVNQKIVKAHNLLGQEVPLDSTDQIIIVLFENGIRKKVYNSKI